MNDVALIETNIALPTRRDVLKLHFYAKLLAKGVDAYPSDIDILVELYIRNGYGSKEEMEGLYSYCVDNKLRGPKQSFFNTITKYVNNGVILKEGRHKRKINPELVPPTSSKFLALTYKVINKG